MVRARTCDRGSYYRSTQAGGCCGRVIGPCVCVLEYLGASRLDSDGVCDRQLIEQDTYRFEERWREAILVFGS